MTRTCWGRRGTTTSSPLPARCGRWAGLLAPGGRAARPDPAAAVRRAVPAGLGRRAELPAPAGCAAPPAHLHRPARPPRARPVPLGPPVPLHPLGRAAAQGAQRADRPALLRRSGVGSAIAAGFLLGPIPR